MNLLKEREAEVSRMIPINTKRTLKRMITLVWLMKIGISIEEFKEMATQKMKRTINKLWLS